MIDDQVIKDAAAAALESVRDFSADPNWGPLHDTIPAEWCGGFMWMYAARVGDSIIECYKHGITRRYLMIDQDRRFFRYRDGDYIEIDQDTAFKRAFDGLESMGWDRSTNYDGAFICRRNAGLSAAGYKVISND